MYQVKQGLLNSELLNVLENHTVDPFNYGLPLGFSMGLKNLQIVYPIRHGQDATIYGRKFIFDIPKGHGYLAQCFIESSLTASGTNATMEDRLGSRVFSDISICTRLGSKALQSVNPVYTNARMDSLDYNLSTHVESSVEPDISPWTSGTATVFSPCFFYFSERPATFLNTDVLEDLQVHCTVNDSTAAMGLQSGLTAAEFKLRLTFYTMFKPKDQIFRSLACNILAYDVYQELPVVMTTGATSYSMNLKCTKTVFAMHMCLLSANQEFHRINSFELRIANKLVTQINRRTNYSIYEKENRDTLTGTFSYWFSMIKSRNSNSISFPMKDLEPVNLTIAMDAVPANYSLYVLFEYWNIVGVSDKGELSRNIVY